MPLSLTLTEERAQQVTHVRLRLRERYGLCVTERDIEVLGALARRYGVAVPGAVEEYRTRWLDAPFRAITVRCCWDSVTETVSTVIPAGEQPRTRVRQHHDRPMAMRGFG